MNAVIALCHFCEAHGPSSIFCTQTLRETKLDELYLPTAFQDSNDTGKQCTACTSIGLSNGIYSRDDECEAIFLSTQQPALEEVVKLVKQAAVRSLSCEINHNKDGGFVFFGDTSRGHVLSHTFHICDLQARGFYQLFSIIILMKDKYFLLNTKPFLAEHIQKISAELKNNAKSVKEKEEVKGSLRQRLQSGAQPLGNTLRSLIDLTGEENIFAILHSHFSWLLLAGSRFLTEHVTFGNLPWLPPQSSSHPPQQRLTYNITTLPMIQKYETLEKTEEFYSLRYIQQVVRRVDFASVCFCALTGVKIIVRGDTARTIHFMMCLKKLLPEKMHSLIRVDAQHQHSISADYKIISISKEIAVPVGSSVSQIDFFEDSLGSNASLKWSGTLPTKLPDLLVKLLKAVDDTRFTELVLNRHTKALVEEWKNKVICLKRAKSASGQSKLKRVLGIQSQDEPLLNYWIEHLL